MWLAPDAIAAWEAVGVGQRGGQRQYSDLAIETALTLRLIVHLPLRQTEGFLTSIFGMLGLDLSAPDHTTLSRRGQHLDLPLRRAPTGAGRHLIVDSTGLSIGRRFIEKSDRSAFSSPDLGDSASERFSSAFRDMD